MTANTAAIIVRRDGIFLLSAYRGCRGATAQVCLLSAVALATALSFRVLHDR